jgi:hypothetical protein
MTTAPINEARANRTATTAAAWLPLLRTALEAEGRFRLPLRGTSMTPTLPPACEIEVVPLAGAPRLGSLIVFASGDALVAHRLVRRAGRRLIAQGDNRLAPDASLDPAQVLGVVADARTDDRVVWPGRLSSFAAALWVARHHVLRPPRALLHAVRRISSLKLPPR